MLIVFTGLLAGGLHTVTGPDHLAALAPLAVSDRSHAVRTGAAWGAGHGLGVVALGALGLVAGQYIDVHLLSDWSEALVGVLLLGIGAWALRAAWSFELGDAHPHDGAALGVGMLHGAAGSGHLFGVLPALALPFGQAALYLSAYLVAAVLSMVVFAGVLGAVVDRAGTQVIRALIGASGALAVTVGVYWLG